MKVKTSISLEKALLHKIDRLPGQPARSQVIEEALILYFRSAASKQRDAQDLELLNLHYGSDSKAENELRESLKFQVAL